MRQCSHMIFSPLAECHVSMTTEQKKTRDWCDSEPHPLRHTYTGPLVCSSAGHFTLAKTAPPTNPRMHCLAPYGSQSSNAATVRATNGHTKVQIYVCKDLTLHRRAAFMCPVGFRRPQILDENASGVRETCVRCQSADERTIAAGEKNRLRNKDFGENKTHTPFTAVIGWDALLVNGKTVSFLLLKNQHCLFFLRPQCLILSLVLVDVKMP